MSTNFYLRRAATCPTCGHGTEGEIHLGKRFAAGGGDSSFIFHAVPTDSPVGPIASAADLRRVLPAAETLGWVVVDENGVTHTAAEFLAQEIDDIRACKRGLHHRMVQEQCARYGSNAPDSDYLDAEGYSFSHGEFS